MTKKELSAIFRNAAVAGAVSGLLGLAGCTQQGSVELETYEISCSAPDEAPVLQQPIQLLKGSVIELKRVDAFNYAFTAKTRGANMSGEFELQGDRADAEKVKCSIARPAL